MWYKHVLLKPRSESGAAARVQSAPGREMFALNTTVISTRWRKQSQGLSHSLVSKFVGKLVIEVTPFLWPFSRDDPSSTIFFKFAHTLLLLNLLCFFYYFCFSISLVVVSTVEILIIVVSQPLKEWCFSFHRLWLGFQQYIEKPWLSKWLPKQYALRLQDRYSRGHGIENHLSRFSFGVSKCFYWEMVTWETFFIDFLLRQNSVTSLSHTV